MYRIVLETDEADYQHVLTGRLCEGEAPVGRGGGALCRSHPEKVGSGTGSPRSSYTVPFTCARKVIKGKNSNINHIYFISDSFLF